MYYFQLNWFSSEFKTSLHINPRQQTRDDDGDNSQLKNLFLHQCLEPPPSIAWAGLNSQWDHARLWILKFQKNESQIKLSDGNRTSQHVRFKFFGQKTTINREDTWVGVLRRIQQHNTPNKGEVLPKLSYFGKDVGKRRCQRF